MSDLNQMAMAEQTANEVRTSLFCSTVVAILAFLALKYPDDVSELKEAIKELAQKVVDQNLDRTKNLISSQIDTLYEQSNKFSPLDSFLNKGKTAQEIAEEKSQEKREFMNKMYEMVSLNESVIKQTTEQWLNSIDKVF